MPVSPCSCLKVNKGTTTDAAEKASIDEAYMDLSAMVSDRLLAAHPFLAQIPVDAPEGIDSLLPQAPSIDWTDAGHVLPTLAEYMESDNEPDEEEEALQRIGVSTTCWSDGITDWCRNNDGRAAGDMEETALYYVCRDRP